MQKQFLLMRSDLELIHLYKQSKDTTLLGSLYERYMDLVYGTCVKYLKSHEDAQDSVIAIYEELMHKLLKHEVNYFKGWLYQLTCNHCLMILRKKKNKLILPDSEFMHMIPDSHQEDVIEKELRLNQLEDCLQTLQEKQKKVIDLFYLQGKCYAEIASMTGNDSGTVRSYIQNGRRNLRNCMDLKASA